MSEGGVKWHGCIDTQEKKELCYYSAGGGGDTDIFRREKGACVHTWVAVPVGAKMAVPWLKCRVSMPWQRTQHGWGLTRGTGRYHFLQHTVTWPKRNDNIRSQ